MKADDSFTVNNGSDGESETRLRCVIEKFKAMWTSFLASREGKGCLTNRWSYLVNVEKLRGEIFAELVRKVMPEKNDLWKNTRIVVDYDNKIIPVLFAKIVTTGKALLPRLYRGQKWSLFKKHEHVLLLFVHKGISSLNEAITLSDLNGAYEEYGTKIFARSVPWIGVGAAQERTVTHGKEQNNADKELRLMLGNKVESVQFNEVISAFVIKARNREMVLCLR